MVASSISEGNVDVGLDIFLLQKLFHLDFIPIAKERYDIIMSLEFYSSWKMEKFCKL